MPNIGEIWRHGSFYTDKDTGELLPKFLLILAVHADGDVVYRLLTSRPYNRPTVPKCFHGNPYPGFYLSVISPSGRLNKETWLDLREQEDFDQLDFAKLVKDGCLTLEGDLPVAAMCQLLSCAANAPDTMKRQAKAILAAKGLLNCS